jgi:hypothetical protein
MKDRTRKLLDTIENAHDWEEGQVYSGGGTQLSSTDTCRICGMTRRYFSDHQNGVYGRYTFATHDGRELTLKEAAELEC